MIGIIHKHDYYILLWLMQGIRKMGYHLKRAWSVPVFNTSCISILAAYVLLAAWMWMITGFATICGGFWACIHGWGWWYLVILAAKDAIHGKTAQVRLRSHAPNCDLIVKGRIVEKVQRWWRRVGDRPKSPDSGVTVLRSLFGSFHLSLVWGKICRQPCFSCWFWIL